MGWDPKTYLAYGAERTRPAADLLAPPAPIPSARGRSRLQSGEFDGAVARTPARRRDRCHRPLAQDVERRARERNIHALLAVQVRHNFDEFCHPPDPPGCCRSRWSDGLKEVRDGWNVLGPETYYELLASASRSIDLWETVFSCSARQGRRLQRDDGDRAQALRCRPEKPAQGGLSGALPRPFGQRIAAPRRRQDDLSFSTAVLCGFLLDIVVCCKSPSRIGRPA
jgi:hypothetical protein